MISTRVMESPKSNRIDSREVVNHDRKTRLVQDFGKESLDRLSV